MVMPNILRNKVLVFIGKCLMATGVYLLLYILPNHYLYAYSNYRFPAIADILWGAASLYIGLEIADRVIEFIRHKTTSDIKVINK